MKKTVIRITGAVLIGLLVYQASFVPETARIAIGIAVGLPSFVLMVLSRRHLGQSFAVMPAAKALVTTGIYSKIQHPMYVFLDLVLAALIIVLDITILLWVWGFIVLMQFFQSRREEVILRQSFGKEYDDYAFQVWF